MRTEGFSQTYTSEAGAAIQNDPVRERSVSHSGSGPAACASRAHGASPSSGRLRTRTRDDTGSQSIPCSSHAIRQASAESGRSWPSSRSTAVAVEPPRSSACGSSSAVAASTVSSSRPVSGWGSADRTRPHRSARSSNWPSPAAGRPRRSSQAEAVVAGTPASCLVQPEHAGTGACLVVHGVQRCDEGLHQGNDLRATGQQAVVTALQAAPAAARSVARFRPRCPVLQVQLEPTPVVKDLGQL
jgi:hypothetical protein